MGKIILLIGVLNVHFSHFRNKMYGINKTVESIDIFFPLLEKIFKVKKIVFWARKTYSNRPFSNDFN